MVRKFRYLKVRERQINKFNRLLQKQEGNITCTGNPHNPQPGRSTGTGSTHPQACLSPSPSPSSSAPAATAPDNHIAPSQEMLQVMPAIREMDPEQQLLLAAQPLLPQIIP